MYQSSKSSHCIPSPFQKEHFSDITYMFLIAPKQLVFLALLISTLMITVMHLSLLSQIIPQRTAPLLRKAELM